MDQFWDEVAHFLREHRWQGAETIVPVELRAIFPATKSYKDVMPDDVGAVNVLVLHKDRNIYAELGRAFLRGALARLRPVLANPVFIVLARDGELDERSREHVASLHEIRAWAAEESHAEDRLFIPSAAPAEHRIAVMRWWDELKATERARDPLRLTRFGRKAFSQNDEDGITLEIFRRIGTKSRRFVEIGVETGIECNTALLLVGGWSGLWIDGSRRGVAAAQRHHAIAIQDGRLEIRQALVTAENIDSLLPRDAEIDLLSIDIDYNNYWVWKTLTAITPRVVIIEYNPSYPPPIDFVVAYEPAAVWDTTSYWGTSLTMLEKLGSAKGYSLVGCCLAGVNAFFVRNDELHDAAGLPRFQTPFTAAEHYEPPRYELSMIRGGHAPGFGVNAASGEKPVGD